MKKILPVVLVTVIVTVLTVSLSGPALASEEGFHNFTYSGDYTAGMFRDVSFSDEFAPYVEAAYNFGFMRGKSAGIFDPNGGLTLGEAVALAARLRSIYHTGSADFAPSSPFYAVYAEYALANGIIDRPLNYTAQATRAMFAMMMVNALPAGAYEGINSIPEYGIHDVPSDAPHGAAVYTLYRAGILAGTDRYGTFRPYAGITRAEVCTILTRIADPDYRAATVLPAAMPAELIYRRNTSAVIMIETFRQDGRSIRTGSGFFISETGLVVTCLHVVENAVSAKVTLSNGEEFDVLGAAAVSEENNLVILSLDTARRDFDYLLLADSDLVETGSIVYALGSPRSLLNAITEGIVSNTEREVSGDSLIQFTAPISFGSGGSPLLNTLGQVIGVASSSFTYAQNLNLAIRVNYIKELEVGTPVPLGDLD